MHLFALFSGHAGKEVAQYLQKHFIEILLKEESFIDEDYELSIIKAFASVDNILQNDPSAIEELNALAQATQNQDKEYNAQYYKDNNLTEDEVQSLSSFKDIIDWKNNCNNIALYSGVSACVCLIMKYRFVIASVGDIKCIIYKPDGSLFKQNKQQFQRDIDYDLLNKATDDNRKILMDEIFRKNNGEVNFGLVRTLGDLEFKKEGIIQSTPETMSMLTKEIAHVFICNSCLYRTCAINEIETIFNKMNNDNNDDTLNMITSFIESKCPKALKENDPLLYGNMTMMVVYIKKEFREKKFPIEKKRKKKNE